MSAESRLLTAADVSAVSVRLRSRPATEADLAVLRGYVAQKEAASADLRNLVQIVMERYGPADFAEVKKLVEERRGRGPAAPSN